MAPAGTPTSGTRQLLPADEENSLKSLSSACTKSLEEELFPQDSFQVCEVVGNFANSFIVLHHCGRLYVVDQHAASEKLLYVSYLSEDVRKPVKLGRRAPDIQIRNLYRHTLAESRRELSELGWDFEVV